MGTVFGSAPRKWRGYVLPPQAPGKAGTPGRKRTGRLKGRPAAKAAAWAAYWGMLAKGRKPYGKSK